jgi:hypothetical protein
MANIVNQRQPLTEKVVGAYEIVYDSPKLKGRGKVTVTSFGPNETHSMVFNNATVGTFVHRTGGPQDEGETYYGKGVLGKGNLLPGALALHLVKVRLKMLAARRKRLGK